MAGGASFTCMGGDAFLAWQVVPSFFKCTGAATDVAGAAASAAAPPASAVVKRMRVPPTPNEANNVHNSVADNVHHSVANNGTRVMGMRNWCGGHPSLVR